MLKYSDIRNDVTSCNIELSGLVDVNLVCTEWWNGEGLDFDFSTSTKERHYSFHQDELNAIVLGMMINGMFDLEELQNTYNKILNNKAIKELKLREFRSAF